MLMPPDQPSHIPAPSAKPSFSPGVTKPVTSGWSQSQNAEPMAAKYRTQKSRPCTSSGWVSQRPNQAGAVTRSGGLGPVQRST